jgi:hypothetical protein
MYKLNSGLVVSNEKMPFCLIEKFMPLNLGLSKRNDLPSPNRRWWWRPIKCKLNTLPINTEICMQNFGRELGSSTKGSTIRRFCLFVELQVHAAVSLKFSWKHNLLQSRTCGKRKKRFLKFYELLFKSSPSEQTILLNPLFIKLNKLQIRPFQLLAFKQLNAFDKQRMIIRIQNV